MKTKKSTARHAGATLRERLQAQEATWKYQAPGSAAHPPVLATPAAHPDLHAPLTIDMSADPSLTWYAGVFWQSSIGVDDAVGQAVEILEEFMNERLLHGVAYSGGEVVAVGLVRETDWARWHSNYERIELRSWRGTYDVDVIADDHALEWALDWAI